MLVYNVYEMSNTATPIRTGRGIPVPGIDTRGPAEKQAASLSFSGWPLTPPQSANDSRRPSLAFSSLSDASTSGPSSIADYSQPSTPVNSMNQDNFSQHWSESGEVQTRTSNTFNDGCTIGQMQPMFHASFHQQAMCSVPAMDTSLYAQHQRSNGFNAQQSPLRQGAWSHSQQPSIGVNMHAPGMKTTLFQNGTGLTQDHAPTASMYANPSSTIPSLGHSVFPNYDNGAPVVTSSMFQAPHTVIPSQISPQEDYPMDQFVACKEEQMSRDFAASFDSSGTDYSAWEHVGPQSPHDAYFTHSDEDDYMVIKDEFNGTPSRTPCYRPHHSIYHNIPDRVKRRTSKRSRKGHGAGKVWHEFENSGFHVRCEGQPFELIDGKPIAQSGRQRKPHQCQVVTDGKPCTASFERSEHLKRHMGMHTNERAYPCPLDDCDKAIGRPDNAADHFKTHLRAPGKGKRNKHCSWEKLEAAILRDYSEKQSTKILTNLRKWMHSEYEKGNLGYQILTE